MEKQLDLSSDAILKIIDIFLHEPYKIIIKNKNKKNEAYFEINWEFNYHINKINLDTIDKEFD